MPQPRKTLISLNATPYYHCVSRCVRQAFLFGKTKKKNYHKRKKTILERLKELSKYFTIDICAFAIMSDHTHLVLHVDLEKLDNLTDDEVLERIKSLYPSKVKEIEKVANSSKKYSKKIKEYRERLSSISWFMKSLNELHPVYIECSDKDPNWTFTPLLEKTAEKIKSKGWRFHKISSDHMPMYSHTQELMSILQN